MFTLLTKYLIVYSQLASEAKPRCKGKPLEPETFSGVEDVGFVRDICVDKIARNVYNKFKYPVSRSCKRLARVQTTWCADICIKWKRSDRWTKKATKRINTKAEASMTELLDLVWKDYERKNIDEEFLFGCVNDAKRQLIDSGAIAEDSTLIDYMEDLKKLLCRRCALSENKDLMTAIDMFIRKFESKTRAKILNHHIDDGVAKNNSLCGIIRLKFQYKIGSNTVDNRVIIKIPSLAPLYHTQWKDRNMEVLEAHFYAEILPALYKLGQCTPFAPILYEVTPERVLVLEDLSVDGYKIRSDSESFDLDHCQISLKVLAVYHALSYVYLRNLDYNDPNLQLIKSYQPTLSWKASNDEFDALCNVIKPHLSQPLYLKIVSLKEKIIKEFATINNDHENCMKMIVHGDFHARNILFKYDPAGKVFRAKIIDWQLGGVANPVLDLIEFFVDDVDIEIIGAHENDLLDLYLTTLNHNLALVSANYQYSRSELDNDMAFYKYYIFRLLSFQASDCLNQNIDLSGKITVSGKIAKWVIYLEKKGFI